MQTANVESPANQLASGEYIVSDDRLSSRRLLVLTAGAALGWVIFVPSGDNSDPTSLDWWRWVWFGVLAGVALVSPIFVVGRRLRGHRAGVGSMLLLTLAFGVLTLLPLTIAERIDGHDVGEGFSAVCLAYCVPFVCLWYLISASVGGRLTLRSLGRNTPWVERLGLYLTFAGAPLGFWTLIELYREAFT